MLRRFLGTLGLAVLALAASAASLRAQESAPGDWYIGAEGGWTNLGGGNLGGTAFSTVRVPGPRGTTRVVPAFASETWDNGYNVGGRVGYHWGSWRFEEEFRHQHNDLGDLTVVSLPGTTGSGHRDADAIMTNVIYDLDIRWPITPHLGFGIGAVDIHDTLNGSAPGFQASSSAWEFGYQAIAGIRYMLAPAWAVDLDYRYFRTTTPTFRTASGLSYSSPYQTHNVLLSLTWLFNLPGPPPPAPAAMPAPPPPVPERVFIVFFDWDKDAITADGLAVIQQAADAYKTGVVVQVQVAGYADRSGSSSYNQRLSERRANNVAKALASLGVPQDQMAISGHGENDNRVPTADGVREPQNRRVEITLP
jgi:OOP family OmpA-OmpF porin